MASEASDEGSLSDHEDEESMTNKGSASKPEVVLEQTDDRECGELERVEGERQVSWNRVCAHIYL